MEIKCFRSLLGISYRNHKTNEEVKARTGNTIGPRLSYGEQFKEGDEEADRGNDGKTTSKSGLALNGISYYGKAENREEWRKLVVKSTVVPQRSARLRDR